MNKPEVILCSPLYGQNLQPSAEERKRDRELLFQNRKDPAVIALFNLIERKAFGMQCAGVQADATAHDQGMACGALEIYQVMRAWVGDQVKEEE